MDETLNIAYRMDCMEYMRGLPDNAFDLAVVDPPYGDGNSQSVHTERERPDGYNRFGGWWNRYKEVQPIRAEVRKIQESRGGGYHGKNLYHMGQKEQVEPGRQSTVKKS